MHIAVVVAVARPNERTKRSLDECARLTYEPRTIVVVSDRPFALPNDPHFVAVVTGSNYLTSPAEKRDLAASAVPGADAYAYLDDDAYPPHDWLDRIGEAMGRHREAAGVGG